MAVRRDRREGEAEMAEFVSFFVLAECFESGSDKTRLDKTKSVNAANIYFSFTSHCYLLSNSFFLSLVFRSLYYHLLLFYILYFTFCFLLIYFSSFLGYIPFLPNNARRKMSMQVFLVERYEGFLVNVVGAVIVSICYLSALLPPPFSNGPLQSTDYSPLVHTQVQFPSILGFDWQSTTRKQGSLQLCVQTTALSVQLEGTLTKVTLNQDSPTRFSTSSFFII